MVESVPSMSNGDCNKKYELKLQRDINDKRKKPIENTHTCNYKYYLLIGLVHPKFMIVAQQVNHPTQGSLILSTSCLIRLLRSRCWHCKKYLNVIIDKFQLTGFSLGQLYSSSWLCIGAQKLSLAGWERSNLIWKTQLTRAFQKLQRSPVGLLNTDKRSRVQILPVDEHSFSSVLFPIIVYCMSSVLYQDLLEMKASSNEYLGVLPGLIRMKWVKCSPSMIICLKIRCIC